MTLEQRDAESLFHELIKAVRDTCDVIRCHEILDAGFDINTATSKGCTALMFAAMPNEHGDPNDPQAMLTVIEALLARGADPSRMDALGMTAADYARQLIDPCWLDKFGDSAAGRWNPQDRRIIDRIIMLLDRPS